ncbi:hypothetical protein O3P69_011800 [Scylla paramamosain]|uniref:Uncharacterized protein n=1 Tax=Scylla paramamosain TaxID=85552 RepID=A0AAW0SI04_SCYPA
MIYVFLVDTGTMMTFDMNLALESVEVVKGAIHNVVKVLPRQTGRGMSDGPVGPGTGSTGWRPSRGLVRERLLGSERDGRRAGRVLLASGGETLDSCKRVCHYSAGTDMSSIFLFSKVAIEGAAPQPPLCSLAGTATSGHRWRGASTCQPPTTVWWRGHS